MLLCTLILDATAVPTVAAANNPAILAQSIGEIVIFIWGSASLLIKFYEMVSGRTKEKEKALADRLKKIEEETHNNTLKHTASQQERERLMDAYNTRNQTVEAANNTRFLAVENKGSQVDTLVIEVNGIKTDVRVQGTVMKSMETQMTDLKNDSKHQFEYIIKLLEKNGSN